MTDDEPPLFVTTMEEFDGDLGATTYESEQVLVHSLDGEGGRAVVGVCSIELPEGECHIAIGIDEPPTARTTDLRVGAALHNDDPGLIGVAIDKHTQKSLGVAEGDVVWVAGDRQTACTVSDAEAADIGLGILRCNGAQRANAGVSLGETVTLSPALTVEADSVELSVPGRLEDGDASRNALMDQLSGHPMREGELLELSDEFFVTSTAQNQLAPDIRTPDDNLIVEVESVSPDVAAGEVVRVVEGTEIDLITVDDSDLTSSSRPTHEIREKSTESIPEWKRMEVDSMTEMIGSHRSVGIVSLGGITSSQIRRLNQHYYNTVHIRLPTNSLLKRALESAFDGGKEIEKHVSGTCGLVVTNFEPIKLYDELCTKIETNSGMGDLELRGIYADGILFEPADLKFYENRNRTSVQRAVSSAQNVAVEAEFRTDKTVPTLLELAVSNANSLRSHASIESSSNVLETIGDNDPGKDDRGNDKLHSRLTISRPTDQVPESVDPPLPESLAYDELDLGEAIDEGGFAEVREAEIESAPDAEIAVKRLSDEGTLTKEIDRFVTEAELWAQCDDHPHVITVIDWGKVPRPWIAMERLTGGDLRERLKETDDGLPIDEGMWIATILAETLADVHHLRVRHLDLQAQNVLFAPTPDDAWMVPKIGDWGVAKVQRSGDTEPVALNPAYAAPEQFEADLALDHRTDVYQLGTVIYELLTGQVPTATGASGESVAERSLPTPPSELRPELSSSVDEVVQTALSPVPEDRYSRAIYMADALDALVEEWARRLCSTEIPPEETEPKARKISIVE